jgi:hypothetical protein
VLAIKGKTGTASVIASGGTSAAALPQALGGQISIDTYAVQTLPVRFDLTSTKRDIAALPGGMFSVAAGAPVNGAAGTIVTNGIGGTETITKNFITLTQATTPAVLHSVSQAPHVPLPCSACLAALRPL